MSRLLSILFFSVSALSVHANGLFYTNHYLEGQRIADICEWKSDLWVTTGKKLYKIAEGQAREVQISLDDNDQITSLYSGSSFTLVCGTFQGNVIFITEDKNDYCHAEWRLKSENDHHAFYVEDVMQTPRGVWLGTIEHGVYLFDPEEGDMEHFSLDFNEDSIGLNVMDLAVTNEDVTWAVAQDGLYFILNIFGKEDSLQYVKSNRFKNKPIDIDFNGDLAYIAHKKRSSNYLSMTKLGVNQFDVRRLKKTSLPDGTIMGIDVEDLTDFWVLKKGAIIHGNGERFREYPISQHGNSSPEANNFVKIENKIYVATDNDGLFEFSLNEPKEEPELLEKVHFSANQTQFGKPIELDMVYFAPGDSNLLSVSAEQLNQLVEVLNVNPSCQLTLLGHTAKDGPPEYLLELSMARAGAVKEFLVQKGIEPSRIVTTGMGAAQLKLPMRPKSPQNRRVEIILVK